MSMFLLKRVKVLLFGLFMLVIVGATPRVLADTKEWTFLVYLNGFNSLDSFGYINLNQMEQIGSSDKVNIVVQFASLKTRKVTRLYVVKGPVPNGKVNSPVIQDLGLVDMGDYRTLTDFVEWGAKNYPAKHILLDVWNHGSGWHFQGKKKKPAHFRFQDISYDDISNNRILTEQLGEALKIATTSIRRPIDVYGSDACLMAMLEVAGEMRKSVNYFVGSQQLEPGLGWPYDKILSALVKNPAMSPMDLSKEIVTDYRASYPKNIEITMAAYDLSKYDALTKAVSSFVSEFTTLKKTIRTKFLDAMKSTIFFYIDQYRDLGDFLREAQKIATKNQISLKTLPGVQDKIRDFVIANEASSDYSRASGAGIWIPTTPDTIVDYGDRYQELQFNLDTHWLNAISATVN